MKVEKLIAELEEEVRQTKLKLYWTYRVRDLGETEWSGLSQENQKSLSEVLLRLRKSYFHSINKVRLL